MARFVRQLARDDESRLSFVAVADGADDGDALGGGGRRGEAARRRAARAAAPPRVLAFSLNLELEGAPARGAIGDRVVGALGARTGGALLGAANALIVACSLSPLGDGVAPLRAADAMYKRLLDAYAPWRADGRDGGSGALGAQRVMHMVLSGCVAGGVAGRALNPAAMLAACDAAALRAAEARGLRTAYTIVTHEVSRHVARAQGFAERARVAPAAFEWTAADGAPRAGAPSRPFAALPPDARVVLCERALGRPRGASDALWVVARLPPGEPGRGGASDDDDRAVRDGLRRVLRRAFSDRPAVVRELLPRADDARALALRLPASTRDVDGARDDAPCRVVAGATLDDALGEISLLGVAASWRGRGAATRVLDELRAWAVELGWPRLRVRSTLLARPAYERAGFALAPEHEQPAEATGEVLLERRL